MRQLSHEKLDVYQKAIEFLALAYQMIELLPREKILPRALRFACGWRELCPRNQSISAYRCIMSLLGWMLLQQQSSEDFNWPFPEIKDQVRAQDQDQDHDGAEAYAQARHS